MRGPILKRHCLVSVALALLAFAAAGIASAGQSAASGVIVLQNIAIIDGQGTSPVEDGSIVIRDGQIRDIGATASVHPPRGAKIIDCHGKTAIPGFISDHSHVGMVSGAAAGPDNYTETNILRALRQYDAYGVTTVTSLGLNGDLFYSLRDRLHKGEVPGADLFGADRGIGVPNGAPPLTVPADRLYRIETPAQAIKAVRQSAARHPDLLKIWVDDFHGTVPPKMQPAVYKAVIDEAHKNHLRVAAHVYYLEDARNLVQDGVDILAHGVRDRPVGTEFIQLLKSHGTWYIPTLDLDEASFVYAGQPAWMAEPLFRHALSGALQEMFADPAWRSKTLNNRKAIEVSRQALAMNQRNLKTLYDAGVHIGFGTDSGAMQLRIPGFAEHRELQLMVESGLSPLQALRTATSQAAALLHLNDRGVLARGKRADLVVLAGNPAVDIRNTERIESVYQSGRVVSGTIASYTP